MTGNEEIIDMPEPLGLFAGQLFDRGSEYLDGFRLLAQKKNELMYAKYFLLAHALELLLKSFLAASGVSKIELRSRKLGHNLPELLSRCARLKMPTVEHLEIFVREIHLKNEDFDFRYPSNYNLTLPSPRLCLEVVDPFRDLLAPIIKRARVDAQTQWHADTRHLKGKKVRWSD